MLLSGLKSDKQVHVNGYWVYRRYNATLIIKAPKHIGQGEDMVRVNCPGSIYRV